jgi:hypothetical protein
MRSRRSTLLLRTAAMVVLAIPATATITFAASKKIEATKKPVAKAAVVTRAPLVVPDVRGQAYVFAKGILEDAGFSWRVTSKNGYSANTVTSQTPAPGTRVVNTGAPTVELKLTKNRRYAEKGNAENASPFQGTALQISRTAASARSGLDALTR